jgi:GT2 family glycosyltransferase
MNDIDLSLIIVNWNTREELRECLGSIFWVAKPLALEVIVVDNASSDGSTELVRREFPKVQLVENGANLGFATACNQGLRLSRGRYIMLLNPDARVVGDALETLGHHMDGQPRVGLITPQILDQDGAVKQSCFEFPSLLNIFLEATLLFRLFPRSRFFGRYRLAGWSHDRERDVDWAAGAALMARRRALEEVGLLDERFFMYSEDIDWCYRFHQLGWRVVFFPNAQVVHMGNRSARQQPDAMKTQWIKSHVLFMRKHHGVVPAILSRLIFALGFSVRLGLWSILWLITRGEKRARARQRIRQWWPALCWCLLGRTSLRATGR